MEASAIPGWSDFFAAAAGVACALAGLVFVGLSINLTQILQLPTAIGRAAETLFVLAGVLVIDLVALVPAQSERHLATLLLIAAIPVWLLPLIAQFRAIGDRPPGRGFLVPMRMLLHQAGTLPIVAGALALFFGHANTGIGLVAAGCILSILVAMLSAWVLLVEIQR
jgi:modulator of FtsH protease